MRANSPSKIINITSLKEIHLKKNYKVAFPFQMEINVPPRDVPVKDILLDYTHTIEGNLSDIK